MPPVPDGGFPAGLEVKERRRAGHPARVSGSIVSDEGEGLVAACLAGGGILLASDWEVGQELASGRLVRVLPEWRFDAEAEVHAVMPPGRLIPAKTRVFLEWLAKDFTPAPPWLRCGPAA